MVGLTGTPVYLLEAIDDLVNQHGCPLLLDAYRIKYVEALADLG